MQNGDTSLVYARLWMYGISMSIVVFIASFINIGLCTLNMVEYINDLVVWFMATCGLMCMLYDRVTMIKDRMPQWVLTIAWMGMACGIGALRGASWFVLVNYELSPMIEFVSTIFSVCIVLIFIIKSWYQQNTVSNLWGSIILVAILEDLLNGLPSIIICTPFQVAWLNVFGALIATVLILLHALYPYKWHGGFCFFELDLPSSNESYWRMITFGVSSLWVTNMLTVFIPRLLFGLEFFLL